MSPRRQTPEGEATKAIKDYLAVIRIGLVKRVNVGSLKVGPAPTHPWQKDTRRHVRFGEVGASDLAVELNVNDPRIPAQYRGRDLFPEVKPLGWTPPPVPKAFAAKSTWEKYRHYAEQRVWLDRQTSRGNLGGFVTSPRDLYDLLCAAGFRGLPAPETPGTAPARPSATRAARNPTANAANRSQR